MDLTAGRRREELSPNALCDLEEAVKLLFSPPPHFSHFTQILTLIHFQGISGLRVKHSEGRGGCQRAHWGLMAGKSQKNSDGEGVGWGER